MCKRESYQIKPQSFFFLLILPNQLSVANDTVLGVQAGSLTPNINLIINIMIFPPLNMKKLFRDFSFLRTIKLSHGRSSVGAQVCEAWLSCCVQMQVCDVSSSRHFTLFLLELSACDSDLTLRSSDHKLS